MIEKIQDWFTASNFRTHIAHLVIVVLGTIIPALLVHIVWHSLTITIVAGNVMAELWMYAMGGREVVSYMASKAKGADMDNTWLDGLGDMVGPVFVRVAWWAGLLTILFGGG